MRVNKGGPPLSLERFMRFQMKWRSWVLLACRNAKKFDSVFVFRGPDHPNPRDENRRGRLRDCQVEIPETSYRQHQCAAEFAPALGQVKGHPIANMLEAICC